MLERNDRRNDVAGCAMLGETFPKSYVIGFIGIGRLDETLRH